MKPAEASAPEVPFGTYWEVVHDRYGTVVGHGFSRGNAVPDLPEKPGYTYHVWPLHSLADLPSLRKDLSKDIAPWPVVTPSPQALEFQS
jgi:hypothetical protein